jgi:nucleoside-diphosphate-sugar epimerase
MAGERIVVTGATGFIGSALVAQLGMHNEVLVLARDLVAARTQLPLGDDAIHLIADDAMPLRHVFEQIKPTVVFHLATDYQRHDTPAAIGSMVDANVRFGSLVLDAAANHPDCCVVLAGSHFQFAAGPDRPATFYAATKNALCGIARYLEEARGLRWIQTVIYDVYGPGDTRPKLVNTLIDRVMAEEPVLLPDPEPLHHFVYIDDVLGALVASVEDLRAGRAPNGGDVFATSAELATPSDVLRAVAAVLDTEPLISSEHYQLPPRTVMRPFEGPRPDGWQPRVSLAEGIDRIVRSVR